MNSEIEVVGDAEGASVFDNFIYLLIAFALVLFVNFACSGCTVSGTIDWHGKTEVKKTTKSPDTIDKHTWW